jgi:hypothetical protein
LHNLRFMTLLTDVSDGGRMSPQNDFDSLPEIRANPKYARMDLPLTEFTSARLDKAAALRHVKAVRNKLHQIGGLSRKTH